MTPNNPRYSSLQTPHLGQSPQHLPLQTCSTVSTTGQVIFSIGHPPQPHSLPQPAAYEPQPDAYLPKRAASAPQPDFDPPRQAAYAPQPDPYPPQSSYALQPHCWSQQFASFLASQPSQVSSYPVSVPCHPFFPATSHPALVSPYSFTGSSTHPAQSCNSQSSYRVPSAPPLSALLDDYQPDSESLYPSFYSHNAHNPTEDSGANEQSFVVRSYLSSSQESHPQNSDAEEQSCTVEPEPLRNPKDDASACNRTQGSGAGRQSFVIRSYLSSPHKSYSEDSNSEEQLQHSTITPVTSFNSKEDVTAYNVRQGSGVGEQSFVIRSYLNSSQKPYSQDSNMEEQSPTVEPVTLFNAKEDVTAHNAIQNSRSGNQSFVIRSYLSPSRKSHSQDSDVAIG